MMETIKILKNLFVREILDENHISNLKMLDNILAVIYGNENDGATQQEIFTSTEIENLKTIVAVFFVNQSNPQLEALKYLENKLLIKYESTSKKYYLTFDGILKMYSNSFENEYRRSVELSYILKQSQQNTILKNNVAIVLSLLSMTIVLFDKC